MSDELRQKVMDKMTKVCTCRAISRASIKEAVNNGAHTVEEVSKVTGACLGSCKGRKCKSKIEELINNR